VAKRASDQQDGQQAPLTGADRVLAALKQLGEYPEGARLDDLARDLASPKSSTHRALAALRRAGLATQDEHGRYRLSLDLVQLAFRHHDALQETAPVRPLLAALAERFGETAHFARLEGSEIVYLGKVVPAGSGAQMTSVIGGRNPAHCTGLGKVLLSHVLPDRGAVDRYLRDFGPLERRTSQTLVTSERLDRELQLTRTRHYAVDRQESDVGIVCIAFPVFLGSPVLPSAAVSVAALAQRTPLRKLTGAADEIRAMIASQLGAAAVLPRPSSPADAVA
jgi:IclR family transcriptional regulator, acetate operon repressor